MGGTPAAIDELAPAVASRGFHEKPLRDEVVGACGLLAQAVRVKGLVVGGACCIRRRGKRRRVVTVTVSPHRRCLPAITIIIIIVVMRVCRCVGWQEGP